MRRPTLHISPLPPGVHAACSTSLLLMLVIGCQGPARSQATPPQPSGTVGHNPASESSASQKLSASLTSAKPSIGTRPLVDFARGAGGFPLDRDELPATRDELVAALVKGYRARVDLPGKGHAAPVLATGDAYPRLDALVIDLSESRIKSDFRPGTFRAMGRLNREVLRIDYLSYTATPLQYVDGRTNLRITARDVAVGLLRGRGEQSALVMTEAKDGRVDFEVTLTDLKSMFLTSARNGGAKAGYRVSDVTVQFVSDDSRSLRGEVRVNGWWLLVPTSFVITAEIRVDDMFDAHLSNVTCRGTDVGGVLAAGFVQNALKKYDGRVMPLATFPGGKIKIRDLQIAVDESLRLFVAFSS